MIQLTRKLSQVFLKDICYIKRIIAAMPLLNNTIIEIGPGSGRMSEHIAPLARRLYAVEIDQRLAGFLREKFVSADNVEIIEQDIREYELPYDQSPLIVFGNIPYAISKDVVEYVVKNRTWIDEVYLTCQKEFVNKLCANEGSEFYGFLSCYIQYYAQVKKLFDIPARAFSPRPRVDSSFVRMKFYSPQELPGDDEKFLNFLKRVFSFPRKQIAGILRDMDNAENILHNCAISPKARPGDISLKCYYALYCKIKG